MAINLPEIAQTYYNGKSESLPEPIDLGFHERDGDIPIANGRHPYRLNTPIIRHRPRLS